MVTVGIRALKQNASAVVAQAAAGEVVTVTDRGRPVARLCPIRSTRVQELVESGLARPPRRAWSEVPAPGAGPSLSQELAGSREAERY